MIPFCPNTQFRLVSCVNHLDVGLHKILWKSNILRDSKNSITYMIVSLGFEEDARVMVQWKRRNRDASGVRILSCITDCPDYPMQFLLLDMNLF